MASKGVQHSECGIAKRVRAEFVLNMCAYSNITTQFFEKSIFFCRWDTIMCWNICGASGADKNFGPHEI